VSDTTGDAMKYKKGVLKLFSLNRLEELHKNRKSAFSFSKTSDMPSFDIVSQVDMQTMDNAVNVTRKEITNRFDFKGSHIVIDLNKKDSKIDIETDSDMQMRQLVDVLISRSMKQGIEAEALDISKEPNQSGKVVKKEVPVRNGLKQEDAKKIVKLIKDSGLKVQAQIMDDTVRITGKKIDDLQEVIQLCKTANLGFPMQYINMRS
jgi:cyclic-di-GMP-binding protein